MEIWDKEKCVAYFNEKYPHIAERDLEDAYDSAYEIFLKTKFQSNMSITEIPRNIYLRNNTWFKRAMECWFEKKGMTSVTSYSENGVSFVFDKTGLSQDLLDEITPFVYMR